MPKWRNSTQIYIYTTYLYQVWNYAIRVSFAHKNSYSPGYKVKKHVLLSAINRVAKYNKNNNNNNNLEMNFQLVLYMLPTSARQNSLTNNNITAPILPLPLSIFCINHSIYSLPTQTNIHLLLEYLFRKITFCSWFEFEFYDFK